MLNDYYYCVTTMTGIIIVIIMPLCITSQVSAAPQRLIETWITINSGGLKGQAEYLLDRAGD